MTTCYRCGLPQLSGVDGYARPQCKCWLGPYVSSAPAYEPAPPADGSQVYNSPTEAYIRRIIREELVRMNIVKDKSHDL